MRRRGTLLEKERMRRRGTLLKRRGRRTRGTLRKGEEGEGGAHC
jgi:hypothetical protein